MSATVMLQHHAEPSLAQIHAALDRHLCRCGAHLRIVRAIQLASKNLREEVTA
jgi:nicotinate dehydrogenase subunit A